MAPLLLAVPQTGFAFGRVGGNIRPYTVTISTAGVVTTTGPASVRLQKLTKQQLAVLNRVVVETSFARLPAVTACAKTLPDVAAQFIRVGARTVRVHGQCLARFNRLWAALVKATG
jgi:hypothetical protein